MKLKIYLIFTLTLIFYEFCFANDPLSEGFLFLEKGDYNRAFSIFSSLRAENPQVLTAKGIAKYFSKDYKRSVYYLERALKFESEKKNWVPNFFAGISNYELKDLSKALYYFNITYTLKPSSEISLWLGKTLFEQGNYVEAEKFLLEALKGNKQREEIYEILLSIYFKFENYDKINEIIKVAKSENIISPIFDFYEAKIYLKKGEVEKAKKVFQSLPKDRFQKEIDNLISPLLLVEKTKTSLLKKIINPLKFDLDNKRLKIYPIFIGILSLLAMGLFYRNRKKDIEQKLDFANELLKANDFDGCEEILDSIRAPYPEKFKIIKIKMLTFKSNFFEAIDLCDDLNDIKIKETLKAYIYLFSNDLLNFQKLIDYVEISLDKETAEELSNLKYHDFDTLKKLFINIYSE